MSCGQMRTAAFMRAWSDKLPYFGVYLILA